jgi:hypothetical protein
MIADGKPPFTGDLGYAPGGQDTRYCHRTSHSCGKVAPEYRDAAEKRRAEQLKQLECSHKADVAKVIPRERTAFLLQCLEAEAVK